jgi:GR25 family glycosyltransferase involved in LPS biosynthesis
MLTDHVEKVFVINLPHRTDRLKSFEDEVEKLHFEYTVFESLDGKKYLNSDFTYNGVKIGTPYHNENYFKGQVGCLLSHLALIKHCKQNNYSKVAILEDDVRFVDDFNSKIDTLFSKINNDWQMLYLSGSSPEFIENFDGYSSISKILTTHSYIIKSDIYDILIDNFHEKLFTHEVDVCYSHIHQKIKTYVSIPFLTYQGAGYSDISQSFNDYTSIKKYL